MDENTEKLYRRKWIVYTQRFLRFYGVGESRSETNIDSWSLLDIVFELWDKRRPIIALALFFGLCGTIYALLVRPVYTATAIVSSGSSTGSTMLSGPLSVASSLTGGTGLSKVAVIAQSQELLYSMIDRHDLLPYLYEDEWDGKSGRWKTDDSLEMPTSIKATGRLRRHLNVTTSSGQTYMSLAFEHHDFGVAKQWVSWYLDLLEKFVGDMIAEETQKNLSYLEKELANATDPILQGKILNLMGQELEKAVLARSNSFQVLARPLSPSAVRPHKLQIVIGGLFFGTMLGSAWFIFLKLLFFARVYRQKRSS